MTTSTGTPSTSCSAPLSAQTDTLLRRTVLANPWIPQRPTPKQALFLTLGHREALFGGGGGGGKSSALLMAALQYVDTPGYAALILRRSYADLALPDAIMARSWDWLGGTAARWRGDTHTWLFPSGATLTFGYLANAGDRFRYQSSQVQFVGWDELTQFPEADYRYLFTRQRRLTDSDVPLRTRGATNPGNVGHDWVRDRFGLLDAPPDRPLHVHEERAFVPALLADNPHLDPVTYRSGLAELDPVTRAQFEHGDWAVRPAGNLFRPEWWRVVDPGELPPRYAARVRYWDLSAGGGDATAGVLLGYAPPTVVVLDVQRYTGPPAETQAQIALTAELDGRGVAVRVEREPGAAGAFVIFQLLTQVLPGYDVAGVPATGEKVVRARPWSAAVGNRLVQLVRGPWNRAFIDEHSAFPNPRVHDDQVDAAAGAYAAAVLAAQQGGAAGLAPLVRPRGAQRRLTV